MNDRAARISAGQKRRYQDPATLERCRAAWAKACGKPVTLNGITYASRAEALRTLGLTRRQLERAIGEPYIQDV